ncbi:hypothetical protein M2311_000271 [Rhizobium leguminosarum]|nr:hypothetical protein [Rhizobium leguminosarum]
MGGSAGTTVRDIARGFNVHPGQSPEKCNAWGKYAGTLWLKIFCFARPGRRWGSKNSSTRPPYSEQKPR